MANLPRLQLRRPREEAAERVERKLETKNKGKDGGRGYERGGEGN
jgi:hypothetical protein